MMNKRTNEQTDSLMDGWMDRWMDGWMDERMNESNGRKKNLYLQVASYAEALRASLSVWGKNA